MVKSGNKEKGLNLILKTYLGDLEICLFLCVSSGVLSTVVRKHSDPKLVLGGKDLFALRLQVIVHHRGNQGRNLKQPTGENYVLACSWDHTGLFFLLLIF